MGKGAWFWVEDAMQKLLAVEGLRYEATQPSEVQCRLKENRMCDCEFTPYKDSDEESWHFLRVCEFCGQEWYGLHCPHDGYQNPCPECDKRPTTIIFTKENKMERPKCLHEYVAVYTLEEIFQSYNLKEDEWDGDTDFGRIHKVISATCNDCDMDLTNEVAKRIET